MSNPPATIRPSDGLPVSVIDNYGVWSSLRIASSIPLGRFEWHWTSSVSNCRENSTSARAVFLIYPTAQLPPPSHSEPHSWFLNPHVFIFALSIDLLDSTAVSDVMPRLRKFIDACRPLSAPILVVLAATPDQLSRFKKAFDKFRADVNAWVRGVDRLVVVAPPSLDDVHADGSAPLDAVSPIVHLHHSPAHRDLLLRLSDALRHSVQLRLRAYDDEVARSHANFSASSCKFPNFFALKEGMAFVFIQLGRRDLALKHYESLYLMLSDHILKASIPFCDLPPADVARGVTNAEYRDYRTRMLDDKISEVDLYTYLFARQTALLLTDRKFTNVAEKGVKLVSHVMRRSSELTISGTSLPISPIFPDVWVFTASRLISTALAPAVPVPLDSDQHVPIQLPTSRERYAVRLVAGFHVYALRALQTLADIALPGCLAPELKPLKNRDVLLAEVLQTSNERLRIALTDRSACELLHSEIANSAASMYEMGGRARGAAALDGDAGRVHLRNASFTEAETLLSAQCARYMNDHGWDQLHRRQRSDLAQAEKQLQRTQEYLVSCLTMLYMGRTSRLIDPISAMTEGEVKQLRNDASYWVNETVKTAHTLPRMMRYKAERLFEITVLPNDVLWEDGSKASATVRIKSDVLASLSVDSVSLECKCLDTTAARKSALHRRRETSPTMPLTKSSRAVSRSPPGSQPSSPTKSMSSDSPSLDFVSLKSARGMVIETGTNDVLVFTSEIPHFGRYRVSGISIFIGKLKLVHSVPKLPVNTVAVVQTGSSRMSPTMSSSSALVDFGVFEARVPFFFASERPPSATLEITDKGPLFLLPGARQNVYINISAQERGIASGAKLICCLVGPDKLRMDPVKCFVMFADINDSLNGDWSEGDVLPLNVKRSDSSCADSQFDIGQAIIDHELNRGEQLCTRIILELSDIFKYWEEQSDGSDMKRSCFLQLELSWLEVKDTKHRHFTCEKETQILFVSPVEISARIELNSEWGTNSVTRGVGLHGTPLGDGGILTCTIESRTRNAEVLNIQNVVLETPRFLELRPDEEPAHASMLPYVLRNRSILVCSFDVFLREESDCHIGSQHDNQDEEESFEQGVAIQKLSRMAERFVDLGISQDKAVVDHDADTGTPTAKPRDTQKLLGNMKRSGIERMGSGGSTPMPKQVTETMEDVWSSKDAEDVVDLSSEDNLFNARNNEKDDKGKGFRVSNSSSLATLKIVLGMEGIVESAVMERRISFEALRSIQKRYGIQRHMKRVGEIGKVMKVEFWVWEMNRSNEKEHWETLEYEVEADPSAWVVIGRQRGKIKVGGKGLSDESRSGMAEVMAIACGRQAVPHIRLFEADGGIVARSQHEDMNEYMQVMVVPCRTVVSACGGGNVRPIGADKGHDVDGDEEEDGDEDSLTAAGNMPAVIESDSLFA